MRTAPTVTETKCRVPALRGRTLADAKRRLQSAKCSVGRVKRVTSKRYAGRVIRTSPSRGRTLRKGSKVNLVVGKPRARAATVAVADPVAVNSALNDLMQGR